MFFEDIFFFFNFLKKKFFKFFWKFFFKNFFLKKKFLEIFFWKIFFEKNFFWRFFFWRNFFVWKKFFELFGFFWNFFLKNFFGKKFFEIFLKLKEKLFLKFSWNFFLKIQNEFFFKFIKFFSKNHFLKFFLISWFELVHPIHGSADGIFRWADEQSLTEKHDSYSMFVCNLECTFKTCKSKNKNLLVCNGLAHLPDTPTMKWTRPLLYI